MNGYIIDLVFANFECVSVVRAEPLTVKEDSHHIHERMKPTLIEIIVHQNIIYINNIVSNK